MNDDVTFGRKSLDTLRQEELLLQFLEYPEDKNSPLQHFSRAAFLVVETVPRNPERTVCLRKLIEAKEAAERALKFTNG